jgi:PadR family transcriptional regulator, regulatory protein PadR
MNRLGAFEHLLLLALVRLGDGTYGVPIRDELEARTGRLVSPGAVYTALDRLERRGLVRSQLGDPTPARGGKRKRCYRLTAKGAAAVRDAHGAIAHMTQGIKPKLQTP